MGKNGLKYEMKHECYIEKFAKITQILVITDQSLTASSFYFKRDTECQKICNMFNWKM